MDIIRGLVCKTNGENANEMVIRTVNGVYYSSDVYLPLALKEDDKVLGLIIENSFNICYSILLRNKEKVFGYFISNTENELIFRLIEGFDERMSDSFRPDYKLGKCIHFRSRGKMTINFLSTNQPSYNY